MEVRHFASFSELVRALRQRHRLSQRALAKTLEVSPGYVGQWELQLSQPSSEVALKICHTFSIDDIEYVQRLAYACRAPEWLRESILRYEKDESTASSLSPLQRRLLAAFNRLPPSLGEHLVAKVEGWVEGILDAKDACSPPVSRD